MKLPIGEGRLAGDLRARLEVTDLELVVDHVRPDAPRDDVLRPRGEYSGSKLNGVPVQSNGLVFMKPFAAEAIMKPLRPVVRSVSWASRA